MGCTIQQAGVQFGQRNVPRFACSILVAIQLDLVGGEACLEVAFSEQ